MRSRATGSMPSRMPTAFGSRLPTDWAARRRRRRAARSRWALSERGTRLQPGDRLLMVSDGVMARGKGKAGLGIKGVIDAALRSERRTAADTIRQVHTAVLEAAAGELDDDATALCLAVNTD